MCCRPKRKNINQVEIAEAVWPDDDMWLKEFLESQKAIRRDYLMDPVWWGEVSRAVNGLSQEFLEVEFGRIGAWLRENPNRAPTPKGTRRFVRAWLEKAYEYERKRAWLSGKGVKW